MTAVERAAEVLAAHIVDRENWQVETIEGVMYVVHLCSCGDLLPSEPLAEQDHQAEALTTAGLLHDGDESRRDPEYLRLMIEDNKRALQFEIDHQLRREVRPKPGTDES